MQPETSFGKKGARSWDLAGDNLIYKEDKKMKLKGTGRERGGRSRPAGGRDIK